MNKPILEVLAIVALVGIVIVGANVDAAGPTLGKKSTAIQAEGVNPLASSTSTAAGAPVALNYTTGFEAGQGFVARDGTCVQAADCSGHSGQCGFIDGQGSGPYPEPWGVSTSNTAPSQIEPHVDTVHPYTGAQHLRFSQDPCDEQNPFGFAVDARIPPSTPLPGLIAPSTYSGQIAIDSLFGTNVFWQPQSNSQGILTTRTLFYFYGWFYILDDYGIGLTYVPVFTSWDASGAYKEITVHHDPCADFICLDGGYNRSGNAGSTGTPCPNGNIDCRVCVGGDDDGAYCIGDFQCGGGGVCTGGTCVGRVDYSYDGQLIYQGSTYAGTSSEQFLMYTDNFPGEIDLDDLVIETGDPCPSVCGNYEIEPGENCDGLNDFLCPGACVPPGGAGPNGEAECTCVIVGGVEPSPLPNGTTNVYSHGGWWTFTADATAYAVDTCGSSFDTAIYVLTGTFTALEVIAFNDDCDDNTFGWGEGADPLASCYAIGGIADPYESCTCISTNIGQQYFVFVDRAGLGETTNITLSKRQDCGAIWEGGACCDGYGGCTDDVLLADCSAPSDTWYARKLCPQICEVVLGACCDCSPGLGGACTDGAFAEECAGPNQTFSLGAYCVDLGCSECRGACCNSITGTCTQTIRGDCLGQHQVWSQETPCSVSTCDDPVPGACCDHRNPDPLDREGICTNGVIWADCNGEHFEWTKGVSCSAVSCVHIEPAIPTVSEWGMVILALTLVVMAKLAFGYVRVGRGSAGASG